ncbi:MAG: hypothetical protein V4702_05415 [Patescibacteria group bacterium]
MIILVLIGAQMLFTLGDFMARANLTKTGFSSAMFLTWWFGAYVLLRSVATVGQLYVLSQLPIGKTYSILGAVGIMLATAGSYLWLNETLTIWEYAGVTLSVMAFLVLTLKH